MELYRQQSSGRAKEETLSIRIARLFVAKAKQRSESQRHSTVVIGSAAEKRNEAEISLGIA